MDPVTAQSNNPAQDYVILLHGLGRTNRSMKPLEIHLKRHGYRVVNINYPSTRHPVEELAEYLHKKISGLHLDQGPNLHFVTHSLGGIILRYYMNRHSELDIGRVVMLSPPNKGSELVDFLKNFSLYHKITGPCGQQLGTEPTSIPNILGPVDFELGIITGNESLNPIFSAIISGDDDGKVSVERSRVEGMKDFLVVPHSHGFIMTSTRVADQIIHFLQNGRFKRADE